MSETQTSNRPMSQQMRAVLTILAADQNLWTLLAPSVDFSLESIDWETIFNHPLSAGHRCAVNWSHALWTDSMRPNVNYFDDALGMDSKIQLAVQRALSVRWGIKAA